MTSRRVPTDRSSQPDLVRDAVDGHRSGRSEEADRARDALASSEGDVRKTEASIERYMLAFEAGDVSQDRFGKRVRELEDKLAALAKRRDTLSASAMPDLAVLDLTDRALARVARDLQSAAARAPRRSSQARRPGIRPRPTRRRPAHRRAHVPRASRRARDNPGRDNGRARRLSRDRCSYRDK